MSESEWNSKGHAAHLPWAIKCVWWWGHWEGGVVRVFFFFFWSSDLKKLPNFKLLNWSNFIQMVLLAVMKPLPFFCLFSVPVANTVHRPEARVQRASPQGFPALLVSVHFPIVHRQPQFRYRKWKHSGLSTSMITWPWCVIWADSDPTWIRLWAFSATSKPGLQGKFSEY